MNAALSSLRNNYGYENDIRKVNRLDIVNK